jgi:hypothetical protein
VTPAKWPALKDFCARQFAKSNGKIIECSPAREIAEELCDALGQKVDAARWSTRFLGLVAPPRETSGRRTTERIFAVYKVQLNDPDLIAKIAESTQVPDTHVLALAFENAKRVRGNGKATALSAAASSDIANQYRRRTNGLWETARFGELQASGSMPALFCGELASLAKYTL